MAIQDIKTANVLVKHFSAAPFIYTNEMRNTLRRDGHLVYAIIDFDFSMIFPLTGTRDKCRIPTYLSWDGTGNQPDDTRQGKLDYNPFVFDVGCLGTPFCEEFQFVRLVHWGILGGVTGHNSISPTLFPCLRR